MTGSTVPSDRRYTATHEWALLDGEEIVVGITDHAQSELTDIVYVNVPAIGTDVAKGSSVLVLESVKTVADIYAPVAGVITRVNEELKPHPELINQDPYGKGWIFRLRPSGTVSMALPQLLDAQGYLAAVAQRQ